MLYSLFIGLILVASVLIILAVLVQSPKSGMAANFGAANQVMGVRESSNFLEKFTWTMAIAILVLSLAATLAMDGAGTSAVSGDVLKDAELIRTQTEAPAIPQSEIPAEAAAEAPAADAAAEAAPAAEAPAEAE